MGVTDTEGAGDPVVPDRSPAGGGPSWRRRSLVVPLVVALVALVGSLALPLAPVLMSTPTVSWPQDPARPTSTMLQLTNQTPLALDVRFDCATARAAGATPDGVLLSTLVPGQPAAAVDGLLVTVRGDRLTAQLRGRVLVDEPVSDGDCDYRVRGDTGQVTAERDGVVLGALDTAALAVPEPPQQPGGDDGIEPIVDVLPDVDVLATSLSDLPDDAQLSVRLDVDNQFNTTPSAAKAVLLAVVLACALIALALLARADRQATTGPASGPRARAGWPAVVVDAVVVGILLLWLFIAPYGDDDGYYAAMARNAEAEGFVGNYYQLFNQAFTPFTWFYRVLGWWMELGDSPVVLRVPALVVGLATWLLLRRFVAQPGALPPPVAERRWAPVAVVVLLAAAFLAWWLPYGMGVRPEAVVGLLTLATLAGVVTGLRRRRLLPVGLGFGAAALAASCHPTGLVALGPVLVALPRLVALVREGVPPLAALTRGALLLAPGAVGSAAAFADGTLNDFLRGQQLFLSVQAQTGWYDEYQRYSFLLSPIAMGSYARRTAVLLGLVSLLWFIALAAAARGRGVSVPTPLVLAAWSLGAAFLLLWITPSKWTHHFGALAGVGPAFLALFLASLPWLAGQVTRGRAPVGVPVLVVASYVVLGALTFRGPNLWPYTWLPGMPHPVVPPYVGPIRLGSPLVWLGVAAVVLAGVALARRRTARPAARPWVVAVPLLVLVFLGTSLTYLVGSFSYATLRTLDSWSPWADGLTDPLAGDCGAAGAIEVLDVATADPLSPAPDTDPADPQPAFGAGSGWFPASPPPTEPGEGAATDVWGSLDGVVGEDATGELTTPWYNAVEPPEGQRTAVLAAGRLEGGNELRVEYAERDVTGRPVVVGSQPLADAVDSPVWRTFVLDPAAAGAQRPDLVRLVAEDRSGGAGGWLALTGPSLLRSVELTEYLPEDAPVATAWQISWVFPCQRQPVVQYGVTEPVDYGIVWRPGPGGWGLSDNTWQVYRGGLFAPVQRTSSVTELATTFTDWPDVRDVQVFRFGLPYPSAAYDLEPGREARMGWAGPAAG